jgi:hypothetical protein
VPGDSTDEIRTSLEQHLKTWGLRRFTSDRDYFAWQQRTFSRNDLDALHRAVESRRQGGSAADRAFYDLTAHPSLIPALYSQRYEYYLEVGSRISAVLDPDQPILDVGCGIGILTMFYAMQHPTCRVIGIDRSSASIDQARRRAKEWGLDNVRFECCDLEKDALPERVPGSHRNPCAVPIRRRPWAAEPVMGDVRSGARSAHTTGIRGANGDRTSRGSAVCGTGSRRPGDPVRESAIAVPPHSVSTRPGSPRVVSHAQAGADSLCLGGRDHGGRSAVHPLARTGVIPLGRAA